MDMFEKVIKRIFEKSNNREDRLLVIVLLVFSIAANLVFISFNSETFIASRPILIVFTTIEAITFIFALLNILQPARLIIPAGGFVAVTLLLFRGGIHDDAIGGYYLLLISCSLLLGRRGLLIFGFLDTAAIIIIGLLETSGKITTHFGPVTERSTVATTAFFVIASSLALYFFITRLSHSIESARRNEREQIAANRDLKKLQAILEKRVNDRTAELQALFASMNDLVIIFDQEGRYQKILSDSSNLLLAHPEDLIGKTIHEFFPKKEADRFVRHIQKVSQTRTTMSIEYFIKTNDRKVYFDASVSPIEKDTVIWVARDITDRKLLEEGAHFIGTHDILTKLCNRAFFEEELSRLDNSRLFPVSVFMFDVDGLKILNDTQGHAAGDEILKRTGKVLSESFRNEDMIARIGGDEFVVLLPKTDEKAAHLALERIEHFLKLDNEDNATLLSISIGMAICTEKGSLIKAIKQADERMYQNKRSKQKIK
jgi:diguanylate cyclase (GGDEF)-like protein/PAS domain S-box-containing protein